MKLTPFYLLILLLILGGCTDSARYPADLLADSIGQESTITLRSDSLTFELADGSQAKIELKVAQVTLDDRSKRRRAFYTSASGEHHYLGELGPLADESRLEAAFFVIRNLRLIVVWLDESLAEDPLDVWLMRLTQLKTDDSPIKRTLHPQGFTNQVGLYVIGAEQADLWQTLAEIQIFVQKENPDGKPIWRQTFEPPLPIEPRFIEVNLQ